MARGLPDFSNVRVDSVSPTIGDLAELAARLGSLYNFDRMGLLRWQEDFRNGLSGWEDMDGDSGGSKVFNSQETFTGTGSIEINNDGNIGQTGIVKRIPSYRSNRVGCAIIFRSIREEGTLFLRTKMATSNLNNTPGMYYSWDDEQIGVVASSGFVDVKAYTVKDGDKILWHYMKFVADQSIRQYVRLFMQDDEIVDGVGATFGNVAVVSPFNVEITISLLTSSAVDDKDPVFLDAVFFTTDEP